MATNRSMENIQLQVLNGHLADYIEKFKNMVSNQQDNEPKSIHDLIEEKMSELWSKVDDEREATMELETLKKRFEIEKGRRETAERLVDELITEKITAELDRDFQIERNNLLKQEITSLKDIYEKKIHELQSQKRENLTETDGSTDEMKEVLQEMRMQETRITLDKQKKRMENMEKQFKKMMGNLTEYEEVVNDKLNLKTEIEKYRNLLTRMKNRIGSEKLPSDEEIGPDDSDDNLSEDDAT